MIRFALLMLLALAQVSCSSLNVVKNKADLSDVKSIAIPTFTSNYAIAGSRISDELTAILTTEGMNVTGYRRLQELVTRQQLAAPDSGFRISDVIGKLEGVDAIVTGNATQKIADYWLPVYGMSEPYISSCRVKVIDVHTGETLLTMDYDSVAPYAFINNATPERVAADLADALTKALSR